MAKEEDASSDTTDSSSKSKKSHSKERNGRRHQRKEKTKAPTKVVVRHLPPTMTEEEFLKQIDPLPEHESYYYVPADWSLGFEASCRAYITLKNYGDVFLFRDRFDGYIFVDAKGSEYPAIVEFAPYQGVIKNRSRRNDNKVNTIEQEAHYQQFIVKLEEEREAAAKGGDNKLQFSLDRKKEEVKLTPLLQYLATRKEKRREENRKRFEEKRKHREEEKEKRRQAQPQPQVTKLLYINRNDGAKPNFKESNNNSSSNTSVRLNNDKNTNAREGEPPKNSRAKRRAERRKEQRESVESAKASGGGGAKETESAGQGIQKKGRDRNKNNANKEKSQKSNAPKVENEAKNSEGTQKSILKRAGPEPKEISESVRDFIKSVVVTKELAKKEAPKADNGVSQNIASGEGGAKALKENEDKKPLKESRANEQKIDRAFKDKDYKNKMQKPEGSENIRGDDRKLQLTRGERRIRNKDRPSIAIYQPRARQRVSEESDSGNTGAVSMSESLKDLRSNPNSDCESVKKDETQFKKKVSRYSERRFDKLFDEPKKRKSVGDLAKDSDALYLH